MKWFFELGDRYAEKSNWVDFAFVKFCLFAMGIIVGVHVSPKHKKAVGIVAAILFISTYIPLMSKVLDIGKEMLADSEDEKIAE